MKPKGSRLGRTGTAPPGTYFEEQHWFNCCLNLLRSVQASHSAGCLIYFHFYGEKEKTKTNSILEQLDWGFWQSGPGAVKQTTTKTGINAENCDTLSETGSWWWWSFRFDNTQRLSQLILSKRKHRDNSITTRKWASVGQTRGAAASVSPGEPSPSLCSCWAEARLRWVRKWHFWLTGSAGRGKWRMVVDLPFWGTLGSRMDGVLGGEEIF